MAYSRARSGSPAGSGLLRTKVFTHLPSNVLLAAIPFVPGEKSAIALLLARFALSQMNVPTRQAYVVAVVDPPSERPRPRTRTARGRPCGRSRRSSPGHS